jgi:hypothetical protein
MARNSLARSPRTFTEGERLVLHGRILRLKKRLAAS